MSAGERETYPENKSGYHVISLELMGRVKCDLFIADPSNERNLHLIPGHFDLAICGNTLCADKLLLRDALAILERRCAIPLNIYLREVPLTTEPNTLEGLFQRRMERLAKYRRRGYQIDVTTDWSPGVAAACIRDERVSVPYDLGPGIMGYAQPTDHDEAVAYWREASDRCKPALREALAVEWKRCWDDFCGKVK